MTDWTAIPLDIGHHHHDPQGAAIPIDSNENDSLRHQLDNLNSVLDSLTTRLYDGQAELRKTTQLLHDKYHMLAESHAFLRSLSATFSLNQDHDAIWNDRGKNQGRKRKRPDPSWRLVPLLQALEAGRGDVQENSEEEEEEGEENQEEETVNLKVVTAEVWDRGEYEDVRWVRLRVKNCGSYPLHSLHLYLHHADPRLAPRCYRHNTIPHLQPGQDATLTASVGHCTSGEKSMGLICRYRCRVEAGGSENAAVEQQRVEEEEGEAGIWKSADVKEVVWRGGAEVKNDSVRGDWRIGLSLGLVEDTEVFLPSCITATVVPTRPLQANSPSSSALPSSSPIDTSSVIPSVLRQDLRMRQVEDPPSQSGEFPVHSSNPTYRIFVSSDQTLVIVLSISIPPSNSPHHPPRYTLLLRGLNDRLLERSVGMLARRLSANHLHITIGAPPSSELELLGPDSARTMDGLREWILAVHDRAADEGATVVDGDRVAPAHRRVGRRQDVCLAAVRVGGRLISSRFD